ncbi:MAG TPA: carboxypeptidase regulatory-like domain-containing protein, partial [Bryobacteraceae bacterium]|nr:carboxypeptidase regulatory-like domain-containing protein [Bryobacteraceae bacterium]
MRKLISLTLLSALLGVSAAAQTITSALTGTVTDPSGAAVPDAKVTARGVSTGVTFDVQTNSAGIYNLPFLPVTEYTVTVEIKGFKRSTIGPFKLEVNQTARVDVKLELGDTTQTVEIKDVAPVLQTETTQTGGTMDSKKLTDLPLNGRNVVAAMLLTPGTVQTNPSSVNTSSRLSGRAFVNGNREQTNNFLLDGVDINDSMDNRLGYTPSVDALQEVQVMTGNGSSEFGNSAGAVVNMTIKSGTNLFHGTLFEFFRNDNLDANLFFSNQNLALPKDKQRRTFQQNQYGFTFGGPVLIPRIFNGKDKLFFFTNWEGTQRRDSGPSLASVAPLAWRNGDLSTLPQTIFDPATCSTATGSRVCQPFANKQIPTARIVGPAAVLLRDNSLYPAPNTTGTGTLGVLNNYSGSAANFMKNNQGDAKVDWRASSNDNFMFRYTQSYYNVGALRPVLPTSAAGVTEAPSIGAVAAWTRSLSPSLVNDFRYGYTRTVIMDTFADPFGTQTGGNAKIGVPGGQLAPGFSSFAPGEGLSGLGTTGILSDGKDNKYHLSETLTWSRGRHFLKFGANGVRYQQNRFYSGNNGALGSFGYTAQFTSSASVGGSAFADFLLDQVSSKGKGQGDGRRWGQRHWRFGTFFQDDFKATNTLTLNLGMRWEYTQPLYEVNDLQANIDPTTGKILLAGQNGNSRALYNPYYKQFMPRVGFAWTPDALKRRMVIRAAYGITSFLEGTGVNLRLPLNPPFFYESNQNYDLTTGAASARVGFSDLPTFSGTLAGNIRTWDPNLRPQFTQQRNVSMEYQFSNSLVASAGYVSQRATHTIVARDVNQPLAGPSNVNPSLWASAQTRRPLYSTLPLVTTTATTESSGTMNYDSFQLSARKRYSAGVDFGLSYTFSKSLNDALGFFGAGGTQSEGAYWQNGNDRNANYGYAAWDARHNLTFNSNIELPFGHGRKFGSSSHRVVDAVLGGWSIGYVMQARTGFPITISTAGQSQQSPRGTQRPNHLRDLVVENRSIQRWFGTGTSSVECAQGTDNGTCAYQRPALGTFGNSSIATERAPGFFNVDASIGKSFRIHERHTLNFRAEAFNIANMTMFNPPSRDISAPGTFGAISAQANNPRNIQLGLK